jgi:hypothetical protein
MRSLKRMIAVAMLAVVATLGAQTAKADGVLLSDRNGILVTDKTDGVLLSDKQSSDTTMDSVINTILNSLTGILLSD